MIVTISAAHPRPSSSATAPRLQKKSSSKKDESKQSRFDKVAKRIGVAAMLLVLGFGIAGVLTLVPVPVLSVPFTAMSLAVGYTAVQLGVTFMDLGLIIFFSSAVVAIISQSYKTGKQHDLLMASSTTSPAKTKAGDFPAASTPAVSGVGNEESKGQQNDI